MFSINLDVYLTSRKGRKLKLYNLTKLSLHRLLERKRAELLDYLYLGYYSS